MPPRRGRPRKGDNRIDAAIDHFAVMGYGRSDIRRVVNGLLKLYGGPAAWTFLEDGAYEVVRNKLFEIEDEEKEKQKQDQQLLLEHNQPLLLEHHQQQDGQQVEDEPPQHHEPAEHEEVEDPMFIEPQDTISISNNEVAADEEAEDPTFIEPLAREAVLPLNAARGAGPRRPCYGWLDESQDEEEEHEVRVLCL